MVIDESGLAAELKRRHKSGYDVAVEPGSVVIMTEDWMVETTLGLLPRKVLGLLVEHMGLLPAAGEALHIERDCDNQEIMPHIIQDEVSAWKRVDQGTEAWVTPLSLGSYQLYQEQELRIVGVPMGTLRIVDAFAQQSTMSLDGIRLLWSADSQTVIMNVYHPLNGRVAEQWAHLESINWRTLEEE